MHIFNQSAKIGCNISYFARSWYQLAPLAQSLDFKDFRFPHGNCRNCRLDVKMILRYDIVDGDDVVGGGDDDDILNNDDGDHNDHRS